MRGVDRKQGIDKCWPYVESKDEWDTKEGTGKSMKNALYVQQCGKRHLSA